MWQVVLGAVLAIAGGLIARLVGDRLSARAAAMVILPDLSGTEDARNTYALRREACDAPGVVFCRSTLA